MAQKGENMYRWGERALARGERDKALGYFIDAWNEGFERERVFSVITKEYLETDKALREVNYRYNAELSDLPPFESLALDAAFLADSIVVFDWGGASITTIKGRTTGEIDGKHDLLAQKPDELVAVLAAAKGCRLHLTGYEALAALMLTRPKARRIFWYKDQQDLRARFYDNAECVLCFAIPTWNRGSYALRAVASCLSGNYYAETGVYVSNNGSDSDLEGYEAIALLQDPRLIYHKINENIGPLSNWIHVVESSQGNFAVILSDEDIVLVGAIAHYLEKFKANRNFGMVRSNLLNYNSNMSDTFYKSGAEALIGGSFRDNHLSGNIYNSVFFNELHVGDACKAFAEKGNFAALTYPHSFFTLMLLTRGDYSFDSTYLVEYTEAIPHSKSIVGFYASLQARLDYFAGFTEVIAWLWDEFDIPRSELPNMFRTICSKVTYLVVFNSRIPETRHLYEAIDDSELKDKTLELFEKERNRLGLTLDVSVFDDLFEQNIAGYL